MSVSQSREGSTLDSSECVEEVRELAFGSAGTLECEPASTKKDQQCFFILSLTSFVLPEFHDLELSICSQAAGHFGGL